MTANDKHREEMKEHIQAAFDERYQRFGANKNAAILAERDIRTTPKYVAELVQEMLQSITLYAQNDYQK